MKNPILTLTCLLAIALAFTACNRGDHADGDKPGPEHGAAASKYLCPMKCEGSASDKPGKCPKCGMALKAAGGHGHATEPTIKAVITTQAPLQGGW